MEYFQLPYDKWEANLKVQLPVKTMKGADYVPYHQMVKALRQHCPGLVPVLEEVSPLPDGTVMVKVYLHNIADGSRSATHRIAIMKLGTQSHHAVVCPDARVIQDGIRRAFCRLISEETGLGYDLWLREDEYETASQQAQAPAQPMPWQQPQAQQPPDFNTAFQALEFEPQPQPQPQQPPQRQRI